MRLFGSSSAATTSLASRFSFTNKSELKQQQQEQQLQPKSHRSSRGANPASSFSSTSSSFSSIDRLSVPLEPLELDQNESLMHGTATASEQGREQSEEDDAEDCDPDLPNPQSKSSSLRTTNLADFRQLPCSMSYKNIVPVRDNRANSTRRRENSSPGFGPALSGDEDNGNVMMERSQNGSTSGLNGARTSHGRYTEASVAALQTRRAFQQMVLELEAEDSDGDGNDSDSEICRASARSSGDMVHIASDDYRKFHFRLRQLEDLCHEQARKQAQMEETIEREVEARTKKVVEAMEKKIAMYKQAKELELEREVQRRLSGQSCSSRGSSRSSSHKSRVLVNQRITSVDVASSSPKPLDRLFHPRRSRKRMEMEEQQRQEMNQFRQFIESTNAAAEVPDELPTPRTRTQLSVVEAQDFEQTSREKLIDMITTLRRHVAVQDTQLEAAKTLINNAIVAREEAEETAREAVELTLELDSRLERASQEMEVIRDELRLSSSTSNVRHVANLPTTTSYLSRSTSGEVPPLDGSVQ